MNMTIKRLADLTIADDSDISGIMVSIENKRNKEIYFGELEDMPKEYYELEIVERSTICASSDDRRIGANVLVVNLD